MVVEGEKSTAALVLSGVPINETPLSPGACRVILPTMCAYIDPSVVRQMMKMCKMIYQLSNSGLQKTY